MKNRTWLSFYFLEIQIIFASTADVTFELNNSVQLRSHLQIHQNNQKCNNIHGLEKGALGFSTKNPTRNSS